MLARCPAPFPAPARAKTSPTVAGRRRGGSRDARALERETRGFETRAGRTSRRSTRAARARAGSPGSSEPAARRGRRARLRQP